MRPAIGPPQYRNDGDGYAWCAPSGSVFACDLRPVPACAAAGTIGDWPCALFLFADDATIPSEYDVLGTGRLDEIRPDATALSAWAKHFGARPAGDTLADWVVWQLTEGSDPDGFMHAPTAIPDSRMRLDLHVPWHSRVRRLKFEISDFKSGWSAKALARTRADLARLARDWRAEAAALRTAERDARKQKRTKDADALSARAARLENDGHARRVLDATAQQWFGGNYGNRWTLFLTPGEFDAAPLPHATSYAEDFDGADKAALGYDLTWTEIGSWDNYNNAARKNATAESAGSRQARAEHDLSSANHYAQAVVTVFGFGASYALVASVAARFSAAEVTAYQFSQVGLSSNTPATYTTVGKIVAGTATALTAAAGVTLSTPDTLRLTCNGTTISGLWNATQTDVTDSAISSGTRCGIAGLRNEVGSTVSLDDFYCADILANRGRILGGSVL